MEIIDKFIVEKIIHNTELISICINDFKQGLNFIPTYGISICYYLDNKQHGNLRCYYSYAGNMCFETTYMHGKYHGTHRTWTENGQLTYEANYLNGALHGLETIWSAGGMLLCRYEHCYTNVDNAKNYVRMVSK